MNITEINVGDGKVCLSPMVDCYDGRIVVYTAGFSTNAELSRQDARQNCGCYYRRFGRFLFSFISSENDCTIVSKKTYAPLYLQTVSIKKNGD